MPEDRKPPSYVGIFFATLFGTAVSSLAVYYATRPRDGGESYADRVARNIADSLDKRFGRDAYRRDRKDI
ncbi:MAG: hypothetical protein HY833_00445 [Candidatus Aenigmarchaeota archaeon]|nr:hypothetical protein [Candidatus Aenigmarchaeota archaeon]